MSNSDAKYIKKLEIEHESSWQIQTAITYDSDVRFRFNNVSRRLKLNTKAPAKFKLP